MSGDTRPPLLSTITSDTEGPFGPTWAWAADSDATAAWSSSVSCQETRIAVISRMVTESRRSPRIWRMLAHASEPR